MRLRVIYSSRHPAAVWRQTSTHIFEGFTRSRRRNRIGTHGLLILQIPSDKRILVMRECIRSHSYLLMQWCTLRLRVRVAPDALISREASYIFEVPER